MALEFALDAAAGTVAAAAVLVALDCVAPARPDAPARSCWASAWPGLAVALAIRLVPRFRAATLDDLSLAMTLDRFRPGIGPAGRRRAPAPRAARRAAVDRVAGPGAPGRPARERGAGRRRSGHALELGPDGGPRGSSSSAPLLVPVAFALVAPDAARLSLARWLRGSNERWPQGTYLSVAGLGDGNRLLAPRDEPFALEVRADLPELQPRGRSLGRAGPGRAIRDPASGRSRPSSRRPSASANGPPTGPSATR